MNMNQLDQLSVILISRQRTHFNEMHGLGFFFFCLLNVQSCFLLHIISILFKRSSVSSFLTAV